MRRLLLLAAVCLLAAPAAAQPREPVPPDAWKDLPPATQVVIGGDFMCTLAADGRAYCWGSNHAGQLGSRTPERCGVVSESGHRDCYPAARGTAAPVEGDARFVSLVAGEYHACGVAADGRGYCWGGNRSGQLGAPSTETCLGREPCTYVPREVEGGRRWRSLHAYEDRTCGVATDGALFCWGGERGAKPQRMAPRQRFTAFAMSEAWCGTAEDGRTHCWGEENEYGQLGTGDTLVAPGFTPVAGGHGFTRIAATELSTCGILADGRAFCWGVDGTSGPGAALGTRAELPKCGFYPCSLSPIAVQTEARFRAIDAGGDRTCALDGEGRAWCWGDDRERQLGLGDAPAPDLCGHALAPGACARVPVRVAGDMRFRSLAVRQFYTCGVTVGDGAVYCWGRVTRGVPRRVPPTEHP